MQLVESCSNPPLLTERTCTEHAGAWSSPAFLQAYCQCWRQQTRVTVQEGSESSPFQQQAACIPAALEGKDIVARARTGSGKTLAYLLPALHKVLAVPKEKQRAGWQALVLVPTRELCEQVRGPGRQCGHLHTLSAYCAGTAYRVTSRCSRKPCRSVHSSAAPERLSHLRWSRKIALAGLRSACA